MTPTAPKSRFQRVYLTLGTGTLIIYAGMVLAALFFFRGQMRSQIVDRTGDLLTRFSQHQFDQQESTPAVELQLVEVALSAGAMEGTIGVRLFYPLNELIQLIPNDLLPDSLAIADQAHLAAGHSRVRYHPQLPLSALFLDPSGQLEEAIYPVVEVLTPIRNGGPGTIAAVQYWLDGEDVRRSFAALDQHLLRLGGFFLFAGGLVYLLLFLGARKRLLSLGRELAERNASLETANRELDLLARSAAIGSVTGHLFHGLKNPLAGLKAYLRLGESDPEALAIADRMQSLVNETLAVLQAHDQAGDILLSLEEFKEMVVARFAPTVKEAGCHLHIESEGTAVLSGRKAQIILLILRNLIENALEASKPGSPLILSLMAETHSLSLRLRDEGSGIPVAKQGGLFEGTTSTKEGGTGIGLAISAVLARHLHAQLSLESSSPNGSTFKIEIPQ